MTEEHTMTAGNTRVAARAERRQFTVDYKIAIVRAAEACRAPGEIGALLRREGLYSSHLTTWRKRYQSGARQALAAPRGPKPPPANASALAALQRENARLRAELTQAGLVIEIQNKVSSLLAALPPAPSGGTS